MLFLLYFLPGRGNGQVGTTTATSDSEDEEILFESSKKGQQAAWKMHLYVYDSSTTRVMITFWKKSKYFLSTLLLRIV
jgi:hypothetical protein